MAEANQVVEELLGQVEDSKQIAEKHDKLTEYQRSILRNVDTEQKSISFFESNDDCPTCKQDIDHAFKHKEISEKQEKIKKYENAIEEIDKQPVGVHAVQHMFHPPAKIDAWPSDDRRSRLVFIVKDIGRDKIEDALNSYLAMDF